MGSLVKTCTTFPAERTIVTRERSKKSYDMGPYFLAKLLAELPIGALFPGVFGTLVYPTTGLHRKWSRYAESKQYVLQRLHVSHRLPEKDLHGTSSLLQPNVHHCVGQGGHLAALLAVLVAN